MTAEPVRRTPARPTDAAFPAVRLAIYIALSALALDLLVAWPGLRLAD